MKHTIKKMNILKRIIFAVVLIIPTTIAAAQSKAALTIGDTAPELKYAKWIKGTPVTKYEKDHLYVFEFWATWCGPCKAAMPHLSELAKKYQGKVTFVGVNIWEKTGDKPYESSLPAVTNFVKSVGDKMAYNVIADNNEQHMANKWMIAAGQNGIPSTFLLKNDKVIWIGHPMKLDSIIELSISGKYDMEAFKQEFNGSKIKNEAYMAKFKILEPMMKAFKAKEYDKTLAIIDTLNISDPMISMQANVAKLNVLFAQKKETEALSFSQNWLKDNKGFGGTVAGIIIGIEGLSKKSYLYAADLGKAVLAEEGVVKPLVQHFIATAYDKAGDVKAAVAFEIMAVQGAKDALKEGKFVGSILDSTVTEFEAQLDLYKKKL
ncbi:TlpA family protein disulfide reductase [Pedobacter nyackensis]|nr:TlpA disulfide reductase family protein [Pedobacter nyackensis]